MVLGSLGVFNEAQGVKQDAFACSWLALVDPSFTTEVTELCAASTRYRGEIVVRLVQLSSRDTVVVSMDSGTWNLLM